MASRLSFERMIRGWQSVFGRAIGVVGLLLVAQLAYASAPCVAGAGMEMTARVVLQDDCRAVRDMSGACIAGSPRMDSIAQLFVSPSLDPVPPSAAARRHAQVAFSTGQAQWPAAVEPRSPTPLYLLFARFLI